MASAIQTEIPAACATLSKASPRSPTSATSGCAPHGLAPEPAAPQDLSMHAAVVQVLVSTTSLSPILTPHLSDVETTHHNPRSLAACVRMLQLRLYRSMLARHQQYIVITIDRRKNPIPTHPAHRLQPRHQRRPARRILQLRRQPPNL